MKVVQKIHEIISSKQDGKLLCFSRLQCAGYIWIGRQSLELGITYSGPPSPKLDQQKNSHNTETEKSLTNQREILPL
jgi:hypothetical protein